MRYILVIIFVSSALVSLAQKKRLDKVLIITSASENVITLKANKTGFYAVNGYNVPPGEVHSHLLHGKNIIKDKVKSMVLDSSNNQVYITFKKQGKMNLNDLNMLDQGYGHKTMLPGALMMVSQAATVGLLTMGVINSEPIFMGAAGAPFLGVLYFGYHTIRGTFTAINIQTSDVFYQIRKKNELLLLQKAPADIGTMPRKIITK